MERLDGLEIELEIAPYAVDPCYHLYHSLPSSIMWMFSSRLCGFFTSTSFPCFLLLFVLVTIQHCRFKGQKIADSTSSSWTRYLLVDALIRTRVSLRAFRTYRTVFICLVCFSEAAREKDQPSVCARWVTSSGSEDDSIMAEKTQCCGRKWCVSDPCGIVCAVITW